MEKESFKISGGEIVDKVKEIIKEGNARRIIVKNSEGHTVVEFPVSIGVIGAVIAPILAAVGAIATLAADYTIEVEKHSEAEK